MASSEERRDEPAKEMVYKTKLIQFLGRSTPIILQNDNGPCPLLAICNVLLLRNNLNLGPDIPEVSQEKLLSLVAERLIDSNSNVNNKDAGYVENQQQNIADAIDLLPRLATGIDVNTKFRRIDDFEFTPECAIFDLLDIPLYHGWIVDPQDYDTMNAIGSKSYNTLMGELVALETRNMEIEQKNSEDNSIDFAAATTAALGVPSPCLSRGRSFDDSLSAISGDNKLRKGDMEEEVELLRVLKLSEADLLTSENDPPAANTPGKNTYPNSEEGSHLMKSEAVVLVETLEGCSDGESQKSYLLESSLTHHSDAPSNPSNEDEAITREVVPMEPVFSKTDQKNPNKQCSSEETGKCTESKGVGGESSVDVSVQNENAPSDSSKLDPTSVQENHMHESSGNEFQKQSTSTSDIHGLEDNKCSCDPAELSNLSPLHADSDSHGSRKQHTDVPDVPDAFTSSANGSEPIYEGEECILESGVKVYEDREPMYEGEVVLAGKVDGCTGDTYDANADANAKDEVSPRQGEVIRSFLKSNASQLTIYGLFCLQDGLKERELCVFFRNNHFNTMFKYDGELYILATDQGYINQPDLVWEKLNEVNGNSVFMTGSFKQFKVENQTSNTWDEQNAMASTADYLANIDNSANVNSSFNSDLQLAIALQQQEFEQQPQRNVQQPTVSTSSSRLVTGPQVPRNNGKMPSLSSKQDAKSSKEKCSVM